MRTPLFILEKQRVTILPNEIQVAVREGQDLFLTCKTEGPAIRNCSWEMNGVARMMDSLTIENHDTKHYGKCRISVSFFPPSSYDVFI